MSDTIYFERYLEQIETTLKTSLYSIALNCAISLPDVCACLESPNPNNNSSVGKRYRHWYNKYAKKYCKIDAEICYNYRCSFVHNHKSSVNHNSTVEDRFKRIAFYLPGTQNCIYSNVSVNVNYINPTTNQSEEENAILIDINEFINGLIHAARDWFDNIKDCKNFKNNFEYFLQPRPDSTLRILSGGIAVY